MILSGKIICFYNWKLRDTGYLGKNSTGRGILFLNFKRYTYVSSKMWCKLAFTDWSDSFFFFVGEVVERSGFSLTFCG